MFSKIEILLLKYSLYIYINIMNNNVMQFKLCTNLNYFMR